MNDNETYTFENKEYVSPTVSRDEQTSFIDTLRQTGQENVDRINQETQALGSQIDPSKGGFSQGTQFESRYVTPQTNALVANLKATAQQTALNQALTNLQNQWSQRYNEAYRAAKIREYEKENSNNNSDSDSEGDVETEETGNASDQGTINAIEGKTVYMTPDGILNIVDNETGEHETVDTNKANTTSATTSSDLTTDQMMEQFASQYTDGSILEKIAKLWSK